MIKPEDLDDLVEKTLSRFGQIDALVNIKIYIFYFSMRQWSKGINKKHVPVALSHLIMRKAQYRKANFKKPQTKCDDIQMLL